VVVERLDAQPVAGRKQASLPAIPDGECEHAAQVQDTLSPMLLVEMKDSLGVALRAVRMTLRFQPAPKLAVVINFSVEDDPDIARCVRKRLLSGMQVNHTQPPHPQSDIFVQEHTVVVGAAMRHAAIHGLKRLALDLLPFFDNEDSAYSAHNDLFFP
jgi:hypothetical protein